MTSELRRALASYRAFREAEPGGVRRITAAPTPKALWRMGVFEFVGYMTTHQGKPALYVHHFAPGSRPVLVAGTKRNALYLLGGRFRITARGITDLDARGREVDSPGRFVTITRAQYADYQRLKRLTRRGRRG